MIVVAGSCGVLEFALIYDELNSLLLVNILQAKVFLKLYLHCHLVHLRA